MADQIAPLVSPEVDLRDFAFMPLDVARLRDSDLASDETPEACWAAVLLWCASWHQVPPASIPNNDAWIAKQAGYAARGRIDSQWKKVRPGALRGWIECSDGRLYHPVVAEKVADAWKSKQEQRWRTECGRIRKHNQRHGTNIQLPDFDSWKSNGCPTGQMLPVPMDNSGLSGDFPMGNDLQGTVKGQGQGQGQGLNIKEEGGGEPTPPDPTPESPPQSSRISKSWKLPKLWGEWALNERPEWTPEHVRQVAEKFRDHYTAQPGDKGMSADWEATWRNWVRKEFSNPQGVGNSKVASPWFMSSPGIEAKANEIGIAQSAGEHFHVFKARVYSAAGITDDMVRRAKIEAGERP